MHVTHQPAIIDIPHDFFNRVESQVGLRRVMHNQNDAGHNLNDKHDSKDSAKHVPIVKVFRRRKIEQAAFDKLHDGKPVIEPFTEGALGLIA